MKSIITLFFIVGSTCCFSQDIDKIITEENVTRVIKTLSSDAMMGRPASRPELMEPAAAFIEKEFKKIGLRPLKGLDGFRQSFDKERISIESVSVTIDGQEISAPDVLIVSDK